MHTWIWTHLVMAPFWIRFVFQIRPLLRLRYAKKLNELRGRAGSEKIRVLFIVGNLAKWKSQSLYDAMRVSKVYEPVVALTMLDIEKDFSRTQKTECFSIFHQYFNRMGMSWVDAYDLVNDVPIPLSSFNPDIVFYQVSGGVQPKGTIK